MNIPTQNAPNTLRSGLATDVDGGRIQELCEIMDRSRLWSYSYKALDNTGIIRVAWNPNAQAPLQFWSKENTSHVMVPFDEFKRLLMGTIAQLRYDRLLIFGTPVEHHEHGKGVMIGTKDGFPVASFPERDSYKIVIVQSPEALILL